MSISSTLLFAASSRRICCQIYGISDVDTFWGKMRDQDPYDLFADEDVPAADEDEDGWMSDNSDDGVRRREGEVES